MVIKDWIEVEGAPVLSGGQGEVRRVRHAADGRVGAIKRLHGDDAKQNERRYRMLTEVSGLRLLAGDGVPAVLDANEDQWLDKATELYLVMDYIEGPTLQRLVTSAPPSLDEALACTRRILDILAAGHAVPVHHRDLKPDNVIVRGGDWSDPVLVDLGTAWDGRADREFETPNGKEMGNRFLRLPEFAPGGDHHDARSDIAMAAGLLFFMLSGRAPRLPVDHNGEQPHLVVPSTIRASIIDDERWSRLSRALTVAFQPNPRQRQRDAAEFRRQLDALDNPDEAPMDELDRETARLRDLTSTAEAQALERARPAMSTASAELYQSLSLLWGQVGLMHAGQGPTFKNGGVTNEFYCVLSRLNLPEPNIVFRHVIMVSDGRFSANWHIDGGPAGDGYYEGPSADGGSLVESCSGRARQLAGIAVQAFNNRMGGGR